LIRVASIQDGFMELTNRMERSQSHFVSDRNHESAWI
jgi:hypothetical protein